MFKCWWFLMSLWWNTVLSSEISIKVGAHHVFKSQPESFSLLLNFVFHFCTHFRSIRWWDEIKIEKQRKNEEKREWLKLGKLKSLSQSKQNCAPFSHIVLIEIGTCFFRFETVSDTITCELASIRCAEYCPNFIWYEHVEFKESQSIHF